MKVICEGATVSGAMPVDGAVDYVVACAEGAASGELEGLRAAVEKLTQIVGLAVSELPPEAAIRVLNKAHFYDFKLEQHP